MKPTLIIMVKEPRPGRVKTRLGRDIGYTASAWWFRHAVARLIRRLRDPRWQIVLSVAPDTAVHSPIWPADLPRLAQGRGDLGARMSHALAACGPGPVCLIGGDIPGVTPAAIWRAFRALGHHDAVFGPATDGGYWLVGVRNGPPRGMFAGTRWSTQWALADSIASLPGARIALIDQLTDIDQASDLKHTC